MQHREHQVKEENKMAGQSYVDKKGLTVKELVSIGIFTALFVVFAMIGGTPFSPNPVLTFYTPLGMSLLCGPMFLLMVAKAPKRWSITILAVIVAVLWYVTGMHWAQAVGSLVLGIIADFVAGTKQYKSKKNKRSSVYDLLPALYWKLCCLFH